MKRSRKSHKISMSIKYILIILDHLIISISFNSNRTAWILSEPLDRLLKSEILFNLLLD